MGLDRSRFLRLLVFFLSFLFTASLSSACEALFQKEESVLGTEVSLNWIHSTVDAQSEARPRAQTRVFDGLKRNGYPATAINRDVLLAHDPQYTHELPVGMITDQKLSGRCWAFSGNNKVRSQLILEKKVGKDFAFSNVYLHFFAMLERSNLYLREVQKMIRKGWSEQRFRKKALPEKYVIDGGFFEFYAYLVEKYGLVPQSAMPETASSGNTTPVRNDIHLKLAQAATRMMQVAHQEGGKQAVAEIRESVMREIVTILTAHFGAPPKSFTYREVDRSEQPEGQKVKPQPAKLTEYTPLQFAKEFVRFKPNDWVAVTASASLETEKVYRIRNTSGVVVDPGKRTRNIRALNVERDRFAALIEESIMAGYPLFFGADIAKSGDLRPSPAGPATGILHPRLYDTNGLYGFEGTSRMDLEHAKQVFFKITAAKHAMVITAVDKPNPDAPAIKFRVENSWGAKAGDRGYLHMYREWVDQHVFMITVHRSVLSQIESDAVKSKAKSIAWKEIF